MNVKYLYSLVAIIVLFLIPYIGVGALGLKTLFGYIIFGLGPFLVGFSLGMTFEKGKYALFFAFGIGMISLVIMYFILFLPHNMGLFDNLGPDNAKYLWWYLLACFFNLISIVPVAAVLASSTNVYE